MSDFIITAEDSFVIFHIPFEGVALQQVNKNARHLKIMFPEFQGNNTGNCLPVDFQKGAFKSCKIGCLGFLPYYNGAYYALLLIPESPE